MSNRFLLVAPGRTLAARLRRAVLAAVVAPFGLAGQVATAPPAQACGGEVPVSCNLDKDDARYLLKRAVAAVEKDERQALGWFSEQSHGFRTVDLYVFCIGSDGLMSAHPDPKLRGTDAHLLVDDRGFRFGDEMIARARAGEIADITYRWPRLDQMKPTTKHTMYERVADQICAVGYYE